MSSHWARSSITRGARNSQKALLRNRTGSQSSADRRRSRRALAPVCPLRVTGRLLRWSVPGSGGGLSSGTAIGRPQPRGSHPWPRLGWTRPCTPAHVGRPLACDRERRAPGQEDASRRRASDAGFRGRSTCLYSPLTHSLTGLSSTAAPQAARAVVATGCTLVPRMLELSGAFACLEREVRDKRHYGTGEALKGLA